MKEIVRIQKLQKKYKNQEALKDINLKINEGEFVGIMGASGSGKSTLLKTIAGINKATSGDIYIDDVETTKLNEEELGNFCGEHIGYIFQDFNLLNYLTVIENIKLPLTLKQKAKNKKDEKENQSKDKEVLELANKLGIESLLSKYPHEISGGEQQRVAIARALILNPEILLGDEPTGSLDFKITEQILNVLKEITNEDKTILISTHDPFTASYCDRILFIEDGKIKEELIKGKLNNEQFYSNIINLVKEEN